MEREAVREAAADGYGSAAQIARRLAAQVAARTLADVDAPPDDRVLSLLARLDPSPVARLATDPVIDTAAIVRAERAAAFENRGWRRLTEQEWQEVDQLVLDATTARLTKRYARHLVRFQP